MEVMCIKSCVWLVKDPSIYNCTLSGCIALGLVLILLGYYGLSYIRERWADLSMLLGEMGVDLAYE